MPGQLAQKVRAKYPGVYDDLDDATLERQILAKYPDYQDLVEKSPDRETPKQEKSVSGFLDNLATSGGKFVGDTIQGIGALGKAAYHGARLVNPATSVQAFREMAGTAKSLAQNAPRIVGAVGNAVKDRYGSLDAIGNTLYTDPVGALGDVSTLTGVGAMAAGSRAPKIASVLSKVEAATNPIALAGKPIAKAADYASDKVIGATVRPPAAVRADFGGTKGVAQAIKKNRVASEAGAQKKLTESYKSADALLAEREAMGVPGVKTQDVASAVIGKPATKAFDRASLGEADQSGALLDRAVEIQNRNPAEIPLTRAQTLKREAQELAYEAGADNQSIKKSAEQAIARSLREGIEQQVPEVGPINQASQELLGAQKAFQAAEDRPRALTNSLSLLGGGGVGAASGDPIMGLLAALMTKGLDSPRLGAMTGIGINELGQGLVNPELVRAALLARLSGQE
jgi:hypothetical protein